MPREPRYLPSGRNVEVTIRTICGCPLLATTSYPARVMTGVLVKAQGKYPLKIAAAIAANNLCQLILAPAEADGLVAFMDLDDRGSLAALQATRGSGFRHCCAFVPPAAQLACDDVEADIDSLR